MKLHPLLHSVALFGFAVAAAHPAQAGDKPAGSAAASPAEEVPKDAEGQYRLAQSWLRGDSGKKDPHKAYEIFKMAAGQGHADAIGAVGYFYSKGITVKKDPTEAAAWFCKGAEMGSMNAQLNYGLALLRGGGVPVNVEEGVKWIDKAAENGQPEANSVKGDFFLDGTSGHRQDYQEALRYYLKAAEAGHAGAQCMAGSIYLEGLGRSVDEGKAEFWFRRSAMQGDAQGMSKLADMLGVENSDTAKRTEAVKWLILADEAGEVMAKRMVELLLPSLPEALLNEARKQANAFKPQAEHQGKR